MGVGMNQPTAPKNRTFLGDLTVRKTPAILGGRPIWELREPFGYQYGSNLETYSVWVPAEFTTDFASIPRFFWRLIPPSTGIEAAVIHDYLYRERVFARHVCDAIFRDALKTCGVGPSTRWLMWAAVRMAGRLAYGTSDGNEESEA